MTMHNFFWEFPPANLLLSHNDVHVWFACLNVPAHHLEQLAQSLSTDEQNRALHFYYEHHRKRFTVGRGLLRAILGRYLDIEPSRLQFCYGPRGKPALGKTFGGSMIRFNMAHSQEFAIYAVSYRREVGIDLECVRPMPDAEQITGRFFSAYEDELFRAISASQKLEAFFNCWTRKEAYLKAIGDGLAKPLDRFSVSFIPGEPARLLNCQGAPQETNRWSFQALIPASECIAAVCVEGQDWHLACWQWPQ